MCVSALILYTQHQQNMFIYYKRTLRSQKKVLSMAPHRFAPSILVSSSDFHRILTLGLFMMPSNPFLRFKMIKKKLGNWRAHPNTMLPRNKALNDRLWRDSQNFPVRKTGKLFRVYRGLYTAQWYGDDHKPFWGSLYTPSIFMENSSPAGGFSRLPWIPYYSQGKVAGFLQIQTFEDSSGKKHSRSTLPEANSKFASKHRPVVHAPKESFIFQQNGFSGFRGYKAGRTYQFSVRVQKST